MQNREHYTPKELEAVESDLTFPRVTKEFMESLIEDVIYDVLGDGTTTVCTLMVFNGTFSVRGESSCMDRRNFDAIAGQTHSYNAAMRELGQIAAAVTCYSSFMAHKGNPDYIISMARHHAGNELQYLNSLNRPEDEDTIKHLTTMMKILNGD